MKVCNLLYVRIRYQKCEWKTNTNLHSWTDYRYRKSTLLYLISCTRKYIITHGALEQWKSTPDSRDHMTMNRIQWPILHYYELNLLLIIINRIHITTVLHSTFFFRIIHKFSWLIQMSSYSVEVWYEKLRINLPQLVCSYQQSILQFRLKQEAHTLN